MPPIVEQDFAFWPAARIGRYQPGGMCESRARQHFLPAANGRRRFKPAAGWRPAARSPGRAPETGQEFIRASKSRNFPPVIGRYRADYTTAKAPRALQEKGVLRSCVAGEYLPSLASETRERRRHHGRVCPGFRRRSTRSRQTIRATPASKTLKPKGRTLEIRRVSAPGAARGLTAAPAAAARRVGSRCFRLLGRSSRQTQ
jgi:hypothetical protein